MSNTSKIHKPLNSHDDEDDDDKPLSTLIAKKMEKNQNSINNHNHNHTTSNDNKKNTKEKPISSDSEDDIPFIDLVKKRIREEKLENGKKEKSREKLDSVTTKSTKVNHTSNSNDSVDFYENNLKGQLLHSLLKRWWYIIEWPKLQDIPTPPIGFEPLDGYQGVFVSTRTDSLGQILDLRDQSTCPNLKNFIKKPSSELKELCTSAIQNQIQTLINAEGENVPLIQTLKTELAKIKSINADKADREGLQFERQISKMYK